MPRKFFHSLARRGHGALGSGAASHLLAASLKRPGLWHLNRRTVAWAVSVGLFFAFIPVPFQMLLAGAAALGIGCNLPIAVATVWVSNPITIAPLFYFAYLVGTWIVGVPADAVDGLPPETTMASLLDDLSSAWKPFIVGCLATGLTSALLGHAAVLLAWRVHVVRAWQQRRALRRFRRGKGPRGKI
jgi:uncharacterized protein (DUF2062 family)